DRPRCPWIVLERYLAHLLFGGVAPRGRDRRRGRPWVIGHRGARRSRRWGERASRLHTRRRRRPLIGGLRSKRGAAFALGETRRLFRGLFGLGRLSVYRRCALCDRI